MPRAKLLVDLPEDAWPGVVSREHPGATLTVLSTLVTDDGGAALLELRDEAAPDVVRDIEDHEDVTDVELLRAAEDVGEVLLRVETTDPRLLVLLRRSRLPIEGSVTIEDGTATLTVAGSRDRLSSLAEVFRANGIAFDVEYVHDAVATEDLLTERQRSLVAAAVEAGYYDTPRECTLTELADARGIAKSTASERLHRAEGKIIKRFVGERLRVDADADPFAAAEPP